MIPTKRILTASILVAIIVSTVSLLSTLWVGVLLGGVAMLGMIEWAGLAGIDNNNHLFAILGIGILGMLVVAWTILQDDGSTLIFLLIVMVLWWFFTAWRMARLPYIVPSPGRNINIIIIGMLLLLGTWGSMVWLHSRPQGRWLLLFLLMLIWIADSGAYFIGHYWGKTPLAPLLSPRKTWEGVYGAMVGALLWGMALTTQSNVSQVNHIWLILLCVITVGCSIIGDLYESLLKRQRSIKDSGALLPGHGGILDRIDSLTAAAPVFVLGLALLGVIK